MCVVVLGAGPERQKVVQAPWEVVSGVRIDGLEQTEDDPEVHGQNVQIPGDGGPEDGCEDGAKAEHHDLDGRGIFSSEAKGRGVLVVNLVDVLVKELELMHCTVTPVVPCILYHEEDGNLSKYFPGWREGDGGGEAAELGHWVEEPGGVVLAGCTGRESGRAIPNLRKLDCEVAEQDEQGTTPLLLCRGNFELFLALARMSMLYPIFSYPSNRVQCAVPDAEGVDELCVPLVSSTSGSRVSSL
jgi:hypothetical protein